jgi:hypothetical protein
MTATLTTPSQPGKLTSLTHPDLTCPPRFATPRNLDRPTLGGKVAEVAKMLGYPLMPWQRFVADVVMEIDPTTGRLYYREWTLLVPRQSGKTTLILALAVHRCRAWSDRQNVRYAAQTRNDAKTKWEDDHVVTLEASLFGRRKPKPYRVRKTTGSEAIIWDNGSMHGIVSNTEKAGHGATLDLGLIDEAFAQVDGRLEQAFKPAQITRPDPQLGILSTAGRKPGTSPYLWGKVESGRERCLAESHPRVAYFEWSAPDNADRADPATWWATMPALGYTVTEEAVAADFASMDPAEFDRAYLNRWNPHSTVQVIPSGPWESCATSKGMADPVCLAVDVALDRSSACISAAGAAIGDESKTAIEPVEHHAGTGWVADRLAELVAEHGPAIVAVDPGGPAGSLLPAFERAGIAVTLYGMRDHSQACGALLDGVLNSRIVHPGHPLLDAAVAGAAKRDAADVWLWSRKSSAVDITPLVSCTLAAWAHSQATQAEPSSVAIGAVYL